MGHHDLADGAGHPLKPSTGGFTWVMRVQFDCESRLGEKWLTLLVCDLSGLEMRPWQRSQAFPLSRQAVAGTWWFPFAMDDMLRPKWSRCNRKMVWGWAPPAAMPGNSYFWRRAGRDQRRRYARWDDGAIDD